MLLVFNTIQCTLATAFSLCPQASPCDAIQRLYKKFITIPTDKLPRCASGGDEWLGYNRFGLCGGFLRPDVLWFGEIPSWGRLHGVSS